MSTTLRRHPSRRAPTIGAGMYQAGRSPSVSRSGHPVERQGTVEAGVGIGGDRLGGELGVGTSVRRGSGWIVVVIADSLSGPGDRTDDRDATTLPGRPTGPVARGVVDPCRQGRP